MICNAIWHFSVVSNACYCWNHVRVLRLCLNIDIRFGAIMEAFQQLTFEELVAKFEALRADYVPPVAVDLDEADGWMISEGKQISHHSGRFFRVEYYKCQNATREVTNSWVQPFIRQIGDDGGILGIVVDQSKDRGDIRVLTNLKYEPGNYMGWQLTSTVQATFDNLDAAHGGRAPHFGEVFTAALHGDMPEHIIESVYLSEDGGRLFNKRNLGMVVDVSAIKDYALSSGKELFFWVSLTDIKRLARENAMVSPHLLRLIAFL